MKKEKKLLELLNKKEKLMKEYQELIRGFESDMWYISLQLYEELQKVNDEIQRLNTNNKNLSIKL